MKSQSSLVSQTQTRSFAAVLFRRIATKTRKVQGAEESKELFIALQDAQKVAIREKLLQNLQGEGLSHVRHKVGDAVAEVARQYAENGTSRLFCLLHLCSMSTNLIAASMEAGASRHGRTQWLLCVGSMPCLHHFIQRLFRT